MLDGSASCVGEEIVSVPRWKLIHERMKEIARRRTALDLEEAEWLVKAERAKVHAWVGCGSFAEYLEVYLGYAPRTAVDRMRVARAVETLPALKEAMRGGMPFTAIRGLARVVDARNVEKWLEERRGKSVHEIEACVRGHKPGPTP